VKTRPVADILHI